MSNWLVYCFVVAVVVYCPGPMTMFALANAMHHGKRIAIIGILGGSLAYIGHLVIVYASLGVLSHLSPVWIKAVRISGASYFFWMAVTLYKFIFTKKDWLFLFLRNQHRHTSEN